MARSDRTISRHLRNLQKKLASWKETLHGPGRFERVRYATLSIDAHVVMHHLALHVLASLKGVEDARLGISKTSGCVEGG